MARGSAEGLVREPHQAAIDNRKGGPSSLKHRPLETPGSRPEPCLDTPPRSPNHRPAQPQLNSATGVEEWKHPNDLEGHVYLGTALVALGYATEGQLEYQRALQIDPDNVDARNGLARLQDH